MQVLCEASQTLSDVCCPVCGKGFQVYWERTSRSERSQMLAKIQKALGEHHEAGSPEAGSQEAGSQETGSQESRPHPEAAFNIPSWSGLPHFSGAALLGGFPGIAR